MATRTKKAQPKAKLTDAPKRLARTASADRELQYRAELTGWTPQRVLMAANTADTGGLQMLADLCETMSADDRIKGVLSTRTHGLLGLPVDFLRGDERARTVLGMQEDGAPGEWWAMHDEAELSKLLWWGLNMGVGLAQRVELPRLMGRPHRYKLVTWSPRWLQYFHAPVDGVHWKVQTEDGIRSVAPGDGEWIVFTPYGERRPWSEGLWRALYFPWLLKRFSLEDRANYSEVLGSPLWVATTGAGSSEKQRRDFLSKIRNLGKNGKIVLPKDWDLKLQEATGKSWEIYENQVAWADAAMTVAIAGQLVTTEGTTGFSDGNIHDAIKADFIRFDAERLATALRTQSLEQWATWNYGNASAAPWPQWQTQRPRDQKDEADGLSKLGDAITKLDAALAPHGFKVDVSKLVDDFDIPITAATAPTGAQ
jgi:phage gp29-like protein